MEFNKTTIDKYLLNQLSPQELESFKNKMGEDADFKNKVETMETLQYGIIAFGNKELKKELQQIHQEEIGEERPKIIPITAWIKNMRIAPIAATMLILIGALAWLFFSKQHIDADDLFAKNYLAYETNLTERNSTTEDKLVRIEQLYQNKNYTATKPLVDKYLDEFPDNAKLKLVSAICALETGKYEEAIAKFSVIKNPLYEDKANWYKALTYLKKGDIPQTQKTLEIVSTFTDSPYSQKANILLEKVKKMEGN